MKDVLTVDEAAEEMGLDKNHVMRLCRSGELEGFKLTEKNWRIYRTAIERFYAERQQASKRLTVQQPDPRVILAAAKIVMKYGKGIPTSEVQAASDNSGANENQPETASRDRETEDEEESQRQQETQKGYALEAQQHPYPKTMSAGSSGGGKPPEDDD